MKHISNTEASLIRSNTLAIIFSLLVSALIMLPFLTFAKGKESANPSTGKVYVHAFKQNAQATITLADFSNGTHSLTIESEDGNYVYYNAMVESPNAFSKVFDLTRLPDGDYIVRVKVKRETVERSFKVKNGRVIVNETEAYAPVFKTEGSKALVLLANQANENVAIKVFSPAGEELYTTYVNTAVRKAFDFSNVSNGNYRVVVETKDNTFAFDYTK